jgi:hypothetical protein
LRQIRTGYEACLRKIGNAYNFLSKHLGNGGTEGRILWILEKQGLKVCTGFNWLMARPCINMLMNI